MPVASRLLSSKKGFGYMLGVTYVRCAIAASANGTRRVGDLFDVSREAAAQTSHQRQGDGGISVSGTVWASR